MILDCYEEANLHKLVDEFTDLEEIAHGGQKVVYKGTHERFGLCVYKSGSFYNHSTLERIKREVKLLDQINSPFFPKIYDFQIDDLNNQFSIIEEWIDSKILSKCSESFDNEIKIITLLMKLLDGLELIWNMNIVHRDLKPNNILIKPNLEPVIIDFGIARFLEDESLTQTLNPKGPCTPSYAAPEQLQNKKDLIDQRTDFFSLGIVINELHLGFHPFDPKRVGNNNSIVENILDNNYVKPDLISGLTPYFYQLITKLLMPLPYQRFKNYSEFKNFICEKWEV